MCMKQQAVVAEAQLLQVFNLQDKPKNGSTDVLQIRI